MAVTNFTYSKEKSAAKPDSQQHPWMRLNQQVEPRRRLWQTKTKSVKSAHECSRDIYVQPTRRSGNSICRPLFSTALAASSVNRLPLSAFSLFLSLFLHNHPIFPKGSCPNLLSVSLPASLPLFTSLCLFLFGLSVFLARISFVSARLPRK